MSIPAQVNECRQITVTRIRFNRGDGADDPIRPVTQYWFNGTLLVEHDPLPPSMKPMARDHLCSGDECTVCTVLAERDALQRKLDGLRRDLAKLLAEHEK